MRKMSTPEVAKFAVLPRAEYRVSTIHLEQCE